MQIIWKIKIGDSIVKSCSLRFRGICTLRVSPPCLPLTQSSSLDTEWHDWNEVLCQPQNPIFVSPLGLIGVFIFSQKKLWLQHVLNAFVIFPQKALLFLHLWMRKTFPSGPMVPSLGFGTPCAYMTGSSFHHSSWNFINIHQSVGLLKRL